MKKVLYIGDLHNESNTASLRLRAMRRIVGQVDAINLLQHPYSLVYKAAYHLFLHGFDVDLPENCSENNLIIEKAFSNEYDVIWIDKGMTIRPETLLSIKKHAKKVILINYSPDNMAKRHCQSKQYLECIPLYDYLVTTKSYIIDNLRAMGAQNVLFVNNCYSTDMHFPRDISQNDIQRLGCDVGFIGAWERARMESVLYLSRNGIKVRVWGPKEWKKCEGDNPNLTIEPNGLFGEDYAKAFKCAKISLCFLRKINDDVQTTRTMEIPACGGFMMAERTTEHTKLFEDGLEACFFDSNEDLLEKCRYFLSHDKKRLEIAANGLMRCTSSGYSYDNMLKQVFERIKL